MAGLICYANDVRKALSRGRKSPSEENLQKKKTLHLRLEGTKKSYPDRKDKDTHSRQKTNIVYIKRRAKWDISAWLCVEKRSVCLECPRWCQEGRHSSGHDYIFR